MNVKIVETLVGDSWTLYMFINNPEKFDESFRGKNLPNMYLHFYIYGSIATRDYLNPYRFVKPSYGRLNKMIPNCRTTGLVVFDGDGGPQLKSVVLALNSTNGAKTVLQYEIDTDSLSNIVRFMVRSEILKYVVRKER